MHGSKTKSIKWLLLLAVFFIVVSQLAQPAFAAPSDFEDLTGEGKSGKVKISVTCYEVTSCQAVFMRSPQPSPFFSFNAGYRGRASDLTVPGLGHSVIRGLVTNRSMVRREFCRLLA